MSFFVANCFDWVGFHIVNHLLEEGYQVDGFDEISTEKKETLSMFVGRNDLFSHIKTVVEKEYKAGILIGSGEQMPNVKADRVFQLYDTNNRGEVASKTTIIKLPLLFGEWMPMTEKGMYEKGTFIPFDSEKFLQEAVYIGDFVNCLIGWMDTDNVPAYLEVKSLMNRKLAEEKPTESIFVRANIPITKRISQVLKHYDKTRVL